MIVVICGAFVLFAAYKAMFSSPGKNDLFGFTPGMPKAEAQNLISKKGWKCRTDDSEAIYCASEAGQFVIRFTRNLAGHPIYSLVLENPDRGGASLEAAAKSLSEQFGKEPDGSESNGFVKTQYRWELSGGNLLYVTYGQVALGNKDIYLKDTATSDPSKPVMPKF